MWVVASRHHFSVSRLMRSSVARSPTLGGIGKSEAAAMSRRLSQILDAKIRHLAFRVTARPPSLRQPPTETGGQDKAARISGQGRPLPNVALLDQRSLAALGCSLRVSSLRCGPRRGT